MTEPCTKESEIATLLERTDEIKRTTEKIFKVLEGNGDAGLVTKVAVLEDRSKMQPSAKQVSFFGAVGGGITLVGVLLAKSIWKAITGP